MLKKQQKSM